MTIYFQTADGLMSLAEIPWLDQGLPHDIIRRPIYSHVRILRQAGVPFREYEFRGRTHEGHRIYEET